MDYEIRVGVVGPIGSDSHAAALEHYDSNASKFTIYDTINKVCAAVQRGEVHYGVVPIRNEQGNKVRATNRNISQKRLRELTIIPNLESKVVSAVVGQHKFQVEKLRNRAW